jgi:hypothetical protein
MRLVLVLAAVWAGAQGAVQSLDTNFVALAGGYTSMVMGAQSFNVTGPAVLLSPDDQQLLCAGRAEATSVAARLPGAVAVVPVLLLFNRSCLVSTQAVALEGAGCAGALFVFTETPIQIIAAMWSVTSGANVTALPLLFLPSYALDDLLLLNGTALASLERELLGKSALLRIISRPSNWQAISDTFGVVFQVGRNPSFSSCSFLTAGVLCDVGGVAAGGGRVVAGDVAAGGQQGCGQGPGGVAGLLLPGRGGAGESGAAGLVRGGPGADARHLPRGAVPLLGPGPRVAHSHVRHAHRHLLDPRSDRRTVRHLVSVCFLVSSLFPGW